MVESVRDVDKHENYNQGMMLIIMVVQKEQKQIADRISRFEIMMSDVFRLSIDWFTACLWKRGPRILNGNGSIIRSRVSERTWIVAL